MRSKRFHVLLLTFICGFGFAPTVRADQSDYAVEFLNIGVGARPLAMGGAFVAAASDATAAYWNPAGLALIDNVEITTIHATQSSIQNYDFLNMAFNTQGAGTYALSYIRLGADNIQITNGSGDVIGSGQAVDQAGLISGGWMLGKDFAVGATLKFLKLDEYTASAYGFGSDLGLLYKPSKELSFGISARDYTGGSYIQWQNTGSNPAQTLQPSLKIGVSYSKELGKRVNENGSLVPESTLTADFDMDTLYIDKGLNTYHFGLEYWYHQFVAIRGGFQSNGFQFDSDNFTLSAGIGVWAYLFEIDYAFVNYQISPTHYLSIITRL